MKRTGLLKTAVRLVLKNAGALFAFEIVYKLALALVLVPLLLGGLHIAMALGGYSYITSENLLRFALHPVTLVILALIVLVVSTLSLIDIYAVIYALEASRQNKKARLSGMALFALKHALRSWKIQNLPIMLTLILMAPLLSSS
ncbi:MAG: glycerophosphoryl diester phosphodiesterase membrane domain-containing protein, partial [Clostridia bacterium]|nr:glycerophosphoryl diester phosphodiesterase membrane domain-containing protein [Clostridia bacterium]